MKTLPALVAVIALPVSALAQAAADQGKPAEVSELMVRARKATEVSGLTVNSNCMIPEPGRQWPNAWFDAPADPKGNRTEESAGTRAYVLNLIADFRNGTADYTHMGGRLVAETHAKLSLARSWIVCRGAFKDIKFLHVSQAGYDDFEVDFSAGAVEWEIKPLTANQVAEQTALRFYYPQPVTGQFQHLLKSMASGRPDYYAMTSDCAAKLERQWPEVQAAVNSWNGISHISFLRREDDGSYTFLVANGQSRALWAVGPLDRVGKITSLRYDGGQN